jgi:hypothetical protein
MSRQAGPRLSASSLGAEASHDPDASAAPLVIVDEPGPSEPVLSNIGIADPATVRPRLAEAAAESVDDIRRTLLDAATSATKDHWVTFEGSECGSRSRAQLPVADVRARVAAIGLLLLDDAKVRGADRRGR